MADPQREINVAGAAIAFGIITLLAFLGWALVFKEIPSANQTLFSTFMGFVGGLAMAVGSYFFGSSANNKRQTEAIANLADAANKSTPGMTATVTATAVKPDQPPQP